MADTTTNPPASEDWRARAEAAEAANRRWEAEAQALVAGIPADLVVRVQEGGGPEDIRATLAVSMAKLVSALVDERRLHDGQVKTLAADFQHNQDQWQESMRKVEQERARQEERGDSHMKRAHAEFVRAEKAEAEVKRVLELIDRDRTGLAAGLAAIQKVVEGYRWLSAGEWGSYSHEEHTQETLRKEIGWAFDAISEIAGRHLTQSGARANAAFLGGPGPTESVDLSRVLVLGDRHRADWRDLGEEFAKRIDQLATEHRREVDAAVKAGGDPARALREQFADERAALLGMFPSEMVVYVQGGSTDENAAKSVATSLAGVLRQLREISEAKAELHRKMAAINEALDEFGFQHPREGDRPVRSIVECVQEAMDTLRTNLAKERKLASRLDGQAALMRGVLELSKGWIGDFAKTAPPGDSEGGPIMARAVMGAIDQALYDDAGLLMRERQVATLHALEQELVDFSAERSWCRKCRTETAQPHEPKTMRPLPRVPHVHAPTCPLFYLAGAGFMRDPFDPKSLRQFAEQQRRRADTAEDALRRITSALTSMVDDIPARLIQFIGGIDDLEKARATLAVTVPHLVRALAEAIADGLTKPLPAPIQAGLYLGTSGGGKTAAMDQLARDAEARGERVVRVGPGVAKGEGAK